VLKKQYRYWRIRIFYATFLGYVFFHLTRKCFTYSMPLLMEQLHFTLSDLGFLSTILYITYGLSKFTSGILSDRSNPRYFMSIGLIITGICNIFFGASSTIIWFIFFWSLNGWFQGFGWPPITKQLTHWYSKQERGRWWSLCAVSHNVGGAAIAIIAGIYATKLGWRYAMYAPGVMSILAGLFLMNRLRDEPQTLGLPPIEVYHNEKKEQEHDEENDKSRLTAKEILFTQVLNNKFIWCLGMSYFFVYIVRTAMNDWSILYLNQEKGYDLIAASAGVSWFEAGGLVGMLVSGFVTDKIFKGHRIPYVGICVIGMLVSMVMFWRISASLWVDYILMASIGFWVYGPQMLIGLAAAENVDKKASGTANGFVGCWAYIGAAFTGYPLWKLVNESWDSFFIVLIVCCVLMIFMILAMLNKNNSTNASDADSSTNKLPLINPIMEMFVSIAQIFKIKSSR
ncbi:MAG: MFS transporter, partial [Francisellaceae bacterium]|nr:MFS transporter [Francisellaceae bacterium]